MRFDIKCEILIKSLNNLVGVIERKSNVPILSCVLINAMDGEFKLSGTNFEMTLIETLLENNSADKKKNDIGDGEVPKDWKLSIKSDGNCVVPVHTLYGMIKKIDPKCIVSFSYDEKSGRLNFKTKNIDYSIVALSAAEYPVFEEKSLPYSFKVNIESFLSAIHATSLAIAKDEARYYLGGVFMHVANSKELRLVSTDGQRLVRYSLPLPKGAENMPGIIISSKTAQELMRVLPKYEGELEINVSNTQVMFNFGGVMFISRLIDGNFPNYETAIPDYHCNDKEAVMETQALRMALERSLVMIEDVPDAEKIITIDFVSDNATIKIDGNTKGFGAELVKNQYQGDSLKLAFNAKFLLEVLSYIKSSDIEMKMQSTDHPMLVFDPKDANVLYMLMPAEMAQ